MREDLRSALRQLKSAPGFAALVVLTLALAIGATTAMYSLVHAVLLAPLDFPAPERIVTLWTTDQQGPRRKVAGPDQRDWAEQSRSFAPLARYRFGGTEAVILAGTAENLPVAAVSHDLFELLGAQPSAGRLFDAGERRKGGAVLVADALVRRHYGGDAGRALGAPLRVLGHSFTIVGVLPAGFDFPERSQVWFPVDSVIPAARDRGKASYSVLGRLAPGVSLPAAQTEMDGIAERLARQYPATNHARRVTLIPLQQLQVGQYRFTLWLLLAAVGLVLLIACANIANLVLARNLRRAREIAVRAALGASLLRITRQLLTESLLLALLGGALGLLVAHLGLDALVALAPRRLPGIERVAINGAALRFAAVVSLGVCVLISLLPVVQAARLDLQASLRAQGIAGAVAGGRMRATLVVIQVSLSLVLLTCAGLLGESLARLVDVDPGYRAEGLLVLEANHPGSTPAAAAQALGFFAELARRAQTLPSVTATTYAQTLPIDWSAGEGELVIEGRSPPGGGPVIGQFRAVGPHYFSTLGIPLRAGRQLDERDGAQAPVAVVINQTLARAAWPGKDPLGQRLRLDWLPSTAGWMTIVGVSADTKAALDQPPRPEIYLAVAQDPMTALSLQVVVRTAGQPLALADGLRQLSHSLNPEVPVNLTTAAQKIGRTLVAPRFRTVVMGLFAGLALLLAMLGVAGVTACIVAEGRAGFGVRLAIGAQPSHIVKEVLLRAARLTGVGLTIGIIAALASARVLQGLLFGVAAADPATLALVSLLLLAAALAAAAWPAIRAARTSPLLVLRAE